MKVVAIFGKDANQRALAHRIHRLVPLAHIGIIQLPASTKRRKLIRSAVSITLARSLRKAWLGMMRHYEERFPAWPSVPTSAHSSANAAELVEVIQGLKPDLILISGTDLLRHATLEQLSAKVMNLHTGISPYIKGGPNCANWALALGEFDLIGNTVMWIDAGIDSGAIIATERTSLNGSESLPQIHVKVMEHAHELYCRAIQRFTQGEPLPAVPQCEIGEGRLFYTRQWDSLAMLRAVANYHFRYKPFSVRDIRLIGIDEASPL